MSIVSLRQVAKDVLGRTTELSIRKDIFSLPNIPSSDSLSANLRLLEAVYRFAPQLWLHRDEDSNPSSVGWYLQRVRMRRHRAFSPDVQVLDRGQVTVGSLVSQTSGGQHSGSGRNRTQFFLEIGNAGKPATKRGDLPSAECYVYFRHSPRNPAQTDIQYWFFYPYNSFGPGHEGDWEHVTVRITAEFEIAQVFFASHAKESSWRSPGGFSITEGSHPVVYSAKSSHACYWFAGKQDRGKWYAIELPPDDFTSEQGAAWDTWTSLRIVGEVDAPLDNQQWVKYTGHWGEIGVPVVSEWLVTSGPYGPAFQAWWDDDDEGNKVP